MEPMATMHHFTHPQWFEDLGGFEREENIPYFVEYCKRLFAMFGRRIKLWATFNEPTVRCTAIYTYVHNRVCRVLMCMTVSAVCSCA